MLGWSLNSMLLWLLLPLSITLVRTSFYSFENFPTDEEEATSDSTYSGNEFQSHSEDNYNAYSTVSSSDSFFNSSEPPPNSLDSQSSSDNGIDLCVYLKRNLRNREGEYIPARPRWRGNGRICEEESFAIRSCIGSGGHGKVAKGLHLDSDTPVALKFLNREPDDTWRHYLYRSEECLQHRVSPYPIFAEHYCTFISTHEQPGAVVMVMELVNDAKELFELIYDNEYNGYSEKVIKYDYDGNWIRDVTAELIGALWFMHRMKVVYRDLKPENILIKKDGTIKLVDFGLASDTRLLTLDIAGTTYYYPPELLKSDLLRPNVPETDWYALGIILYEMAFHKGPFPDVKKESTMFKLILGGFECQPLPDGNFEDLCDLIHRLTDPDHRRRLGRIEGSREIFLEHPFLRDSQISDVLYEAEKTARKLGEAPFRR